MIALGRIDYRAQQPYDLRKLLNEVFDNMLPDNCIDFVIIYKLLIVLSKLCIAKNEDIDLDEFITKCDDKVKEFELRKRMLDRRIEMITEMSYEISEDPGLEESIVEVQNTAGKMRKARCHIDKLLGMEVDEEDLNFVEAKFVPNPSSSLVESKPAAGKGYGSFAMKVPKIEAPSADKMAKYA